MTTVSLPPPSPPRLHLVADPADHTGSAAHPPIEGTFRSPEGRCGRLTGSLRMERLLITPHGTFVCGVVTGHLRSPADDVFAVASRAVTAAADLVHEGGRTTAHVRPFDLDLIGIPVRVAAFSLEPTSAVATDDCAGSGAAASPVPRGRLR